MLRSLTVVAFAILTALPIQVEAQHSVAREWNEALLFAIRRDFARPTVHARNLFHSSFAMYDAWAAYDDVAETFFLGKTFGHYDCPFEGVPKPEDVEAAREAAISYAMFRLLNHRFQNSPGAATSLAHFEDVMISLGYDPDFMSSDYASGDPRALGNHIALHIITFGLEEECNEDNNYANLYYMPSNPPLIPILPGNPDLVHPNHWQPLTLDVFIDQSGNIIPLSTPQFLSPEWGVVIPFALAEEDLTIYPGPSDFEYWVYHDPGAPPQLDTTTSEGLSAEYLWNFALVAIWSSHLDPADSVMIDISPASFGNNPLESYPTTIEGLQDFYKTLEGGDYGTGHDINPHTGEPYEPQMVPRGDYTRVLAEFWADGPDSETPPGHWFTILNYVNDHPLFEKRYMGKGPILPDLEWDVKAYFTLAGAVHDAAVTAWGIKGYYDYIRPISAIRSMAERGQSSDENLPNYHPAGMPLYPGYIELVEEGDPLAGEENVNVGKIKLKAWRGPDYIDDPEVDEAGVGWILAENWWPYQRPTFITPPFAGYVSGHSTFSRAAAEVMTMLTGDPFFPGGMGEFHCEKNEFLVFEEGPSVDLTLQWATYRDASDQTSLSRIWGGIHPPADDVPGRLMGIEIGVDAFELARCYFNGPARAICRDYTVIPDENGEYTIELDSIFAGSEGCGIQDIYTDLQFIPCSHTNTTEAVTLVVVNHEGVETSCKATVTLGGDADCDAVSDACDICPGVDDAIDLDGDLQPDCMYFTGQMADIAEEWRCLKAGKVFVTVVPPGPDGPVTRCVSLSEVPDIIAAGGYLGPAGSSGCSEPQQEVYLPPKQEDTYGLASGLVLYPNPVSDDLTIDMTDIYDRAESIEVFDSRGVPIWEAQTEGRRVVTVDTRAFVSGLYWTMIHLQDGTFLTSRFVVD